MLLFQTEIPYTAIIPFIGVVLGLIWTAFAFFSTSKQKKEEKEADERAKKEEKDALDKAKKEEDNLSKSYQIFGNNLKCKNSQHFYHNIHWFEFRW